MLAPISWLKDYTPIKLGLAKLMWRMTEIGLTTESFKKVNGDVVLDVEVTPNRPDWLSLVGIAREIAVIHQSQVKLPKLPLIPKPSADLPISVKSDPKLSGRYTGVTISGVKVKSSPSWMQKRLKLVGLRPINNLVDITNYVTFELGVPIHVFDYDKFLSNKLTMQPSKGGEKFTSVDGLSYKLPKDAIIIKDKERVIDLCGIKGGVNTGISESTKNIFIHLPIYVPKMIRRTSQKMKLASEASYIYERGANAGGTLDSLKRTVSLTLNLGEGKIASEIIDLKKESFEPWKLDLNLERLETVLGINIPKDKVMNILSGLSLSPKPRKGKISCKIPTFRGDLKIEEDLIEEVARIWGYNKFPKTLPIGDIPTDDVPYRSNLDFLLKLKNLMAASGYSEAMTLSLVSAKTIANSHLDRKSHIKLANPVSAEYEYMRMSLIPSLLAASKINQDNRLKILELSKVYLGEADKSEEPYKLSAIAKNYKLEDLKGTLELLLSRLNIASYNIKPTAAKSGLWHPVKSGVIEKGTKMIGTFGEIHPRVLQNFEIKDSLLAFELDVEVIEKLAKEKPFEPLPKFPAQIEDITLVLPSRTKVGDIIKAIKSTSKLIVDIQLTDIYKDSYAFRLYYQHPKKTLTNKEVEKARIKFLKEVKKKFGATQKS